ncbi:hypothetical protein [Paenibacillus sp. MDMC362]|nr:hypothetical protein [Paenibacillus sp. MDMC362]
MNTQHFWEWIARSKKKGAEQVEWLIPELAKHFVPIGHWSAKGVIENRK